MPLTYHNMPAHQHPRPRVSRLYRNATLVFLGCAVVIAGAIAFVSFSLTTITVTLTTHDVTATPTIAIAEEPNADTGTIAGKVLTVVKEGAATHDVPKDGSAIDDYAHGTVTFTNEWTKTQPLAAGTRLKAASNGLIYRTTARVDVAVGRTTAAEVVCDAAGASGEVGPDRFEIVALWPGLKEKIYAESATAFTGGTRSSAQLSQATIDGAKAALSERLADEASTSEPSVPDGMTLIDVRFALGSTMTASAKAGDQVGSFSVKGTTTLAFIAVDQDALDGALAASLASALPADERYLDDAPEAVWKLLDISEKNGTAHLQVALRARATLTSDSTRLTPERFVDRTSDEIRSTLLGTPGVSAVSVAIAPFWASRTPANAGQIRVTVIK